MLGSRRRGADPAASSKHRGAAGPGEFPRVVGGGAIGTVWVSGWRRRSGKPVPALALAPDPPLGSGGELRSWNPSGTDPKTFPRAPFSFCLSGQRRRRLSCDPLVLASLALSHRYCGRARVLSLPAFVGGGRVPQMRESGRPHPGLTHPPAVTARRPQPLPHENGV